MSPQCEQCLAQVDCEPELDQCFADQSCVNLLECHEDCGWAASCYASCQQQHPNGLNDFYAVMACAVCGACFTPCASSDVAMYCFDEG